MKSIESKKEIAMKNIITGGFHSPVYIWLCLALFVAGVQVHFAQGDFQHTKGTVDQTLRSNARINPSTLAMELSIPISDLPGRGGAAMPLVFNYSSKVWQLRAAGSATVNQTDVRPIYSDGGSGGWTTSYDVPTVDAVVEPYSCYGAATGFGEVLPTDCYNTFYYVKRIRVKLPGGTTHELRKDDAVYTTSTGLMDRTGTFYAVDGTRVRLEWGTGGEATLFMPDGGRYLFDASQVCTKYIDRHGNTLLYNSTTRAWTDTLGRTLAAPRSDNPTEGTQNYLVPGLNNTTRTYQFVWKKLSSGALLSGDSLYYVTRDCSSSSSTRTDLLFQSTTTIMPCDGRVGYFDPIVLNEIILPNGQKYQFSYNHYGEIERIDYPTGAYEKFVYKKIKPLGWDSLDGSTSSYGQANRGIEDRYVGGEGITNEQHWHYSATYETTAAYGADTYTVETTAPDGTRERRFLYKTTRPPLDELPTGNYGFDTPLAGREMETQTLDTNGAIRSRTIYGWETKNGAPVGYNDSVPQRDPKQKWQVSVIIDPGISALATMTETVYETPGQNNAPTDEGYFAALNPIRTKSYHYVSVNATTAKDATPAAAFGWFNSATPAAITETDYLYDANYQARNISGLATDTRVIDPATSAVKAKSHVDYDEATYLETGAAISGWENPNTNLRGLPTTSKVWNDTNNSWISTHTQYDQFGNVRKTWDGRGNFTEIQYTDNYSDNTNHYSYALPTKTITSSNGNGTGTLFETSVKYDYKTGLPVSTTDANNQTTLISYADPLTSVVDPLLRVRRVTAPNGQQTITDYGAGTSAATRYIKSKTQIDADKWKEGYSWFDGLGRAIKSQSVDAAGDVFAETEYDSAGRPKKVSNPHRANETVYWAENTYDELSRVTKVKTSGDNAEVNTTYSLAATGTLYGTIVTVTDQALKQRRSITNALGQLKRVDEPTTSGLGAINAPNQATSYSYNTLNNLTEVSQGAQTRNFVYDSLSRLQSATNPESGLIQYTYDANGNLQTKRDARGIKTVYDYDNLNRVAKRCYRNIGTSAPLGMTTCNSNNETAEPNTSDVVYTYENTSVTSRKGVLTKVANGTSMTEYISFDIMGRVTQSRQTTDGVVYGDAANPMTYIYNLSGALIEEKYPSGRVVKNVLDADGDLALVQSKKNADAGYWNYAKSFTYTAAGAVSSMQLGNGRWESTVFNSRLQPEQIALGTTQGSTDKLKLNFTYNTPNNNDNNGNVLKQTITTPSETRGINTYAAFTATQTYTYDELNRLKSAEETIPSQTGWKQTFTYDRYGNRNFDTTGSNTTTLGSCATAVCNPQASASNNKFSTTDGYTYDTAGNTKVDAMGRQFTYDGENKQTKVQTVDGSGNVTGTLGEYFYDGDGKRVKKVVGTETTIFVYDASGKMVAEYATTVGSISTAQVSYLTADHLGSPRINTDANGTVQARHDYQPFGEEIYAIGSNTARTGYSSDAVRQKFTGYQREAETPDLDFAQARYYKLAHGRFTSPDPLMASAKAIRPESWNRYIYCYNNPLALIDPNGMEVQLLDKKATERVLSTLPEEIRKQVEKKVDKNGMLKRGTLDKIKSKDANFLDLKLIVNRKETVEIMTSDKDSKGNVFTYETLEEARQSRLEMNIENGMSESEAKADADKFQFSNERARTQVGGDTLSPEESPSHKWRVIVPDGSGQTSKEPQSEFATSTAHELYGHVYLGIQGKPFRHEYRASDKPLGPVDARTTLVETRTRNMYPKNSN